MIRYLACCWPQDAAEVEAAAETAIGAAIGGGGWGLAVRRPGLAVLTPPGQAAPVRAWGDDGAIVGELYAKGSGRAEPAGPNLVAGRQAPQTPAREAAGRLLDQAFGRYVALRAGRAPFVLRDPSGAVDCLVWSAGAITVVSNALEGVPPGLSPRRLRLDWDAIALSLGEAVASAALAGLAGLTAVPPGCLCDLAADRSLTLAWDPRRFVGQRREGGSVALAGELSDRVDVAVRALVGARSRVLAEVSGGLDSAIVAGAIARLGLADRVAAWLNYYGDRPEGDERVYARTVTDQFGGALTCVRLPVQPVTEADFAEVASGPRLPTNALLPFRDRDTAARLRTMGASALVSGQGGDAVFYQMPTAMVLADSVRARGLAALWSSTAVDVCRWLRQSWWDVTAEAVRGVPRARPGTEGLTPVEPATARSSHPWVQAAADVSPAKRLQVLGLANAHVATGACRTSADAELLYPLTAQPVAEFCLGVPAERLTEGGRERALARAAFADRLPEAIRRRRKKGELTAFYAQTIAASLDFLRPHLLDGCLCEAGVLDRRRLEAALQRDQLLWRGEAGALLVAAAAESWVRHWQRYVPDAESAQRHGWLERFRDNQSKVRA